MKPLVSVIIPNYNAEKYIEKCITSVVNQSYRNVEIIVVDDGSTDASWGIITRLASEYTNIKAQRQGNLNAAIARNRGMEMSNGKYLFFLDSDDMVTMESITELVRCAEEEEADLVIGNYTLIDEEDRELRKCRFISTSTIYENPMYLVGMVPNPSNKLFRKQIIEENQVIWGNVRIGQDLNFFLKYLMCCKRVSVTEKYIYGWRILQGSISNTFNFRIFDIVESFRDTKRFYVLHGAHKCYAEYIAAVEYRHFYLQMEKQKNFKDHRARKVVVDYFKVLLEQIDLSSSINMDQFASDIKKCKLKIAFEPIYISNLYALVDRKFARKHKV